MLFLAPPKPPPIIHVDLADHDDVRHLHHRLRIVGLTSLTVIVTAWLCTFGLLATLLALVIAKHVLVAILVMALGVDSKGTADLNGSNTAVPN